LNHATFLALRAGAIDHGNRATMPQHLAKVLVPLYARTSERIVVAPAVAQAFPDVRNPSRTRLRILNPSPASFRNFERDQNGERQMPNDNLQFRTEAGRSSGQAIQEVNLLRIRVDYREQLILPFVDRIIPASVGYPRHLRSVRSAITTAVCRFPHGQFFTCSRRHSVLIWVCELLESARLTIRNSTDMQRKNSLLRCCFGLLAGCGCLFLPLSLQAQTSVQVSGSIGATSDFIFRGLSYTRGDPAAQASLDVETQSGLYAGTFVSTTNPNPGASPPVEVDLWAGWHREFSAWISADLRYTHYMYPDDPRVADYDRDEITATLGLRGIAFVSATYSPNTDAIASAPGYDEGDTWTAEVSARHALSERWSVSAGVGRYFLDEIYGDDYDYWGATLSADFAPIELHLAVLGADDTAERIFSSRTAGERVAVTVLYRFAITR
jgi:uncharacterized protein (TIGR02001 family)